MTVSSGFYNSVEGDRKYNAKHFNEIFDGLLSDGVYVNYGNAFRVSPLNGLSVKVGSGRGWFKNTWIVNDADEPVTLTSADPMLKRIDAVVIDINTSTQVRNNSIQYLTGTPHATAPAKPTLIDEATHKQYPLAWILVNPGVTEITSNDITDCIRTGEMPAIEALLEYSSHTKDEIDARFSADENPSFNDRSSELPLANLTSGESLKSMLGKIKQIFGTLIGHSSLKPTFYRYDGVFATPPTVDGTQPGYCPQLPAEQTEGEGDDAAYKYLRADGTWVAPPNTPNNNAVAQNSAQNANSNFPILLKGTAAAENAVDSSKWDADMTYNPSTNQLNVKKIVGDSVNGVKFGVSGNNRGYYDANGNFKTFRQPTGNAGVAQVLKNYTFANASSDALTGTMENYSGGNRQTVTPAEGRNTQALGIAGGYHDSVNVNTVTVYDGAYRDGYNAAQAITWEESYYLYTSHRGAGNYFSLKNVTAMACTILNGEGNWRTYNSAGQQVRTGRMVAGNPALYFYANETAVYVELYGASDGEDTGRMDVTLYRTAKPRY